MKLDIVKFGLDQGSQMRFRLSNLLSFKHRNPARVNESIPQGLLEEATRSLRMSKHLMVPSNLD